MKTQPRRKQQAEFSPSLENLKITPVGQRLITLLPFIGFMLGIVLWVIDAAIDVFIINPNEEFLESLLAEKHTEMWMRTAVIIVLTFAALFVQYFMRKQAEYENLLLKHQAQLEHLVSARTHELQYLANFDELTGIYNRRKFNELFDSETERAKRYNQPLSLVLLDIDHFKMINDKYGHNEGDEVLKAIAEILRKHLRRSDVYARWGGEEFIILMTHTSLDTAGQVAEKLRGLLCDVRYGNINENISASFGVSSLHTEEQITPLIKRADDALYDAKRNGRNRVCVKA